MKNPWDVPFRYVVLIILVGAIIATLWYVREVFKPLLTAGLMAYFLSPAVNFLTERYRIRRKVSANLVYFVVLSVLIALPFTILPALLDEIQGIITDFNVALNSFQAVLSEPKQFGNITVYLGGLIPALRSNFNGSIVPRPEDALRVIQFTSRNFLWLLVVLVAAYYLMTEWERLRNWFIQLAPEEEQSDLNRLYIEIRKVWTSYLGGQIRLILILAVMYSIAWSVIGLPGAVAIGLLAGLLNLVPEVGPASAALLAAFVALLEGSNFLAISNIWFCLLTVGVYLLLNTVKTVWLQPRVLGHSVLLHEGVVFVAIITAIMLMGVLGVLIVVPLLATLVVIGRYLRRRVLGLTPFEEEEPASSSVPSSDSAEPELPALTGENPQPAPSAKKSPRSMARSPKSKT